MMHRVFVYGTLKKDFPNHHVNKGKRIPGSFKTKGLYTLYLVGDRFTPWLVEDPSHGMRIRGEVYELDEDALIEMDALESIGHVDGYQRVKIIVIDAETDADTSNTNNEQEVSIYLKSVEQLNAAQVQKQLGDEYSLADAALYTPRH